MGKGFDLFMQNPYWKELYDNAPSERVRGYLKDSFEYSVSALEGEDQKLERESVPGDFTKEDVQYLYDHSKDAMGAQRSFYKRWLESFDEASAAAGKKVRYKGRSDPMDLIHAKVYEVLDTWRQYYYIKSEDGDVYMYDYKVFDVVPEDTPELTTIKKARYLGETDLNAPKKLIHGNIYDVVDITTFYYVKREDGVISIYYDDEFENVEEEKEK